MKDKYQRIDSGFISYLGFKISDCNSFKSILCISTIAMMILLIFINQEKYFHIKLPSNRRQG